MSLRWSDVVGALLAAAAAGALTVAAETLVLTLAWPLVAHADWPDSIAAYAGSVLLSLWFGVGASGVFATGLTLIGLPGWWALDRLGLRTRLAAVFAGALLAAAALEAIARLGGYPFGIWGTVLIVPPGAIAGWTLHRVAYGPPARSA